MGEVALVMPMAGRGSRFGADGSRLPKPLRLLWGRPFFWWAAESARRSFAVAEMVFVLLQEHVEQFEIDRKIAEIYPAARFVAIPEVTNGAAETALIGIEAVGHKGPLVVNDSDHAFVAPATDRLVARLGTETAGALLSFASDNPAYSYVRRGAAGDVIGTAEKEVVSGDAITGAYLFADADTYRRAYAGYAAESRYHEVYISGLYDRLIAEGGRVDLCRLTHHIPFGTPPELERLGPSAPQPWAAWS